MVSKKFVAIIVIIAMLITFIATATITTGALWFLGVYSGDATSFFSDKEVSKTDLKKFNELKNILKKSYYKKVDDNTLIEGAIAGMADSLQDPYTVYYNKKQMKEFSKITDKSQDTYVGIGVQVSMDKNGILEVIEPFKGSPALKAGIKSGDKIIKVDGKDVTKIRDENVIIGMIKGPKDTKVKITVYREDAMKELAFNIQRKEMTVVINISSKVLDNNIGYIKMAMFDSDIYANFKKELDKLQAQDIKGLIIDVRDNPGGSYEQVVELVDLLLPKGLIVYTEDRQKIVDKKYSDANELKLPLTILVNENSASASEILAGAVQDYKKGTLVGTKTFGKGLVQSVVPFSDGSGMKYTIARYFTPKGVCIQGKGIKPDIKIKNDKKYDNEPLSLIPQDQDKQLNKAIEITKSKIK